MDTREALCAQGGDGQAVAGPKQSNGALLWLSSLLALAVEEQEGGTAPHAAQLPAV